MSHINSKTRLIPKEQVQAVRACAQRLWDDWQSVSSVRLWDAEQQRQFMSEAIELVEMVLDMFEGDK